MLLKYIFVLAMNIIRLSFSTSANHLFVENIAPVPSYWLMARSRAPARAPAAPPPLRCRLSAASCARPHSPQVGLVPVIALLPDFTIRAFKRVYYPDDEQAKSRPARRRRRRTHPGAPRGCGVQWGRCCAACRCDALLAAARRSCKKWPHPAVRPVRTAKRLER